MSLLRDSRPPLKRVARAARVDGLRGIAHAIAPVLGQPRGSQRRGGVEQDDISAGPAGTLEHFARDARVVLGSASADRVRVGWFETDISRVELVLLAAAVDLDDQ